MRLVDRAHELLGEALREGDLAIDATAGNGHDVAFLAEQVGSSGMVYAFDLQNEAIEATTRLLKEKGVENVELHQCGHETMDEVLPPEIMGQVAAVTFNLGYLPGGDKSVVTQTTTTRMALRTVDGFVASRRSFGGGGLSWASRRTGRMCWGSGELLSSLTE